MTFRTARSIIVAAICILGFSGCATDYKARSLLGGFSETQFAENVFEVQFEGNEFTTMERATDFALLRSAEISLQHGYPYFAILDTSQCFDTSTYITPPTSNTTFNVNGNASYASGTATTTYQPGGETTVSRSPIVLKTITCLKAPSAEAAFTYDAAIVLQSIRSKYRLAGNKRGQNDLLNRSALF